MLWFCCTLKDISALNLVLDQLIQFNFHRHFTRVIDLFLFEVLHSSPFLWNTFSALCSVMSILFTFPTLYVSRDVMDSSFVLRLFLWYRDDKLRILEWNVVLFLFPMTSIRSTQRGCCYEMYLRFRFICCCFLFLILWLFLFLGLPQWALGLIVTHLLTFPATNVLFIGIVCTLFWVCC